MSAATDPHTCLVDECRSKATPPALMCDEHWTLVPVALRASLMATCGEATAENLAYIAAARAEVTHKLHRQGRTPRAAKSKPVQLALF